MISEAQFRARQRMVLTQHYDANDTLFLERELTQLRAKMFTTEYAEPVARNFLPKATDIANSASVYSYKVYTPVGKSKLISYKSDDIPRVDVGGREVFGKVVPIAAAYAWDINELREAARLNLQLSDIKARAAADQIERDIDTILAFGTLPDENGVMPDIGLQGLANNPDVIALNIIPATFWTGGAYDPDAILRQISMLASASANLTDNRYAANTLLLPTYQFSYVQQTPFSSLSGDSILTVFRKNNPQFTTIAPWFKLNTAGVGGVPRAIAFKKDPMVLEAVIPQEFEVMPPEMKGLEMLNNCHARCGGTKIYRPMAVKYMDFATS